MKTNNKTRSLRALIVALCLTVIALLAGQAWAQQVRYQPTPHPARDMPMTSILYDLCHSVTIERADPESMIRRMVLLSRGDGTVNVEIINREGPQRVDLSLITRFVGEVHATWHNRVSAWIPADQLIGLAQALPPGFFVQEADQPYPDDEGPGVIGSDAYVSGGADGSGRKIAIIDTGFRLLTTAQASGAAPAIFGDTIDFTGVGVDSGARHGTGCLETVYDHAPGATYYLYKISTATDLGNAVDAAIDSNVHIISHSISWYNQGWDDNSGAACDAVADAAGAGILFFTSAGNRAKQHWQGDYNDGPDVDGWHDWVNGDETINIIVNNNDTATFVLSWNTAGGTYNYDLYLLNSTVDSTLANSVSGGNTFERFSWWNNTGSAQTVKLAVNRVSGGTTEMEVFNTTSGKGVWQEHVDSAGSTTSPSNSTELNCISVGAVHWNNFTSPPGTGSINMDYSSQGPSNGGGIRPRLCGPTNTTTVSYGGAFTGTSAATPNAAGATAAFWSSAPNLHDDAVSYLVREKAEIFKDWGSNGPDNYYGRGGVALHIYHTNTVWVDRRYGNISGFFDLPFYYVTDAETYATDGGRIVFLGQNYPELITLDKELRYETIGWPALLGD